MVNIAALAPAYSRARESRTVILGTNPMMADLDQNPVERAALPILETTEDRGIAIPRMTLIDLDTDINRRMLSDTWISKLSIQDPIDGHTYLGCAIGHHDIDVTLELSFVEA